VTAASASAYTAGAVSVDDQVTAYSYDAAGHALQEVDAAGVLNHVINYSYDKFGRVAKQWRTVTSDGLKQTVFEIRQYDALGRIAHVIKPGNLGINDDPATTNKLIDNETQYTAFGEVRLHVLNDENGRYLIDQFKYDNAGNAWFTNEGDGVEKIRLFDAHGRLTSEIRSTGDNVPHW
jgi:YD repeat-containing protein